MIWTCSDALLGSVFYGPIFDFKLIPHIICRTENRSFLMTDILQVLRAVAGSFYSMNVCEI